MVPIPQTQEGLFFSHIFFSQIVSRMLISTRGDHVFETPIFKFFPLAGGVEPKREWFFGENGAEKTPFSNFLGGGGAKRPPLFFIYV